MSFVSLIFFCSFSRASLASVPARRISSERVAAVQQVLDRRIDELERRRACVERRRRDDAQTLSRLSTATVDASRRREVQVEKLKEITPSHGPRFADAIAARTLRSTTVRAFSAPFSALSTTRRCSQASWRACCSVTTWL